jgi:hypothetical protein
MNAVFSLMADFVERGFGPNKPESPREIRVNLDGAPDLAARLVNAMAANNYKVSLGEFVMRHTLSSVVTTLEAEIEAASEGDFDDFDAALASAGADGGPLQVASTLLLCHDRGGETALGASWGSGQLSFVVVELAEPFEDNFVTHLTSPAALSDYLSERNRKAGFNAADLDAIRERVT